MPNELRAPSKEIEVLEPADEDESSPPRKKSPIVAAVVDAENVGQSPSPRQSDRVRHLFSPLTPKNSNATTEAPPAAAPLHEWLTLAAPPAAAPLQPTTPAAAPMPRVSHLAARLSQVAMLDDAVAAARERLAAFRAGRAAAAPPPADAADPAEVEAIVRDVVQLSPAAVPRLPLASVLEQEDDAPPKSPERAASPTKAVPESPGTPEWLRAASRVLEEPAAEAEAPPAVAEADDAPPPQPSSWRRRALALAAAAVVAAAAIAATQLPPPAVEPQFAVTPLSDALSQLLLPEPPPPAPAAPLLAQRRDLCPAGAGAGRRYRGAVGPGAQAPKAEQVIATVRAAELRANGLFAAAAGAAHGGGDATRRSVSPVALLLPVLLVVLALGAALAIRALSRRRRAAVAAAVGAAAGARLRLEMAAAATAPNTGGVDQSKYGSESIVRIVKTPSGRVGVTPVRRSRRLSATPRRAGDFRAARRRHVRGVAGWTRRRGEVRAFARGTAQRGLGGDIGAVNVRGGDRV